MNKYEGCSQGGRSKGKYNQEESGIVFRERSCLMSARFLGVGVGVVGLIKNADTANAEEGGSLIKC